MTRNMLLLVPVALFAAGPAFARDVAQPPRDQAQMAARALANPAVQAGVSGIIGEMADALLDTHVGPLAHYTDPRDDLRPSDTLRDVAERDDPAFERHMRERTRGAVAAVGMAAGDMAAMSGEFQATAARLRRVLDAASSAAASADDREGY